MGMNCIWQPFFLINTLNNLHAQYTLKQCHQRLGSLQNNQRYEWIETLFLQKNFIKPELEARVNNHNIEVIETMLNYYAGDIESLSKVESLGDLLSERKLLLASIHDVNRSKVAVLGKIHSKGKSAPVWVKTEFIKRESELKQRLKDNTREITSLSKILRTRAPTSPRNELIQ